MTHPACMNRHACWLLLLLLLASAGCCCCCCWLLLLAAAQQQPAAAAATSSSQQPAAAASSQQQQPAAEQQQPSWLLHGHAAASKPGCMVHGMLLLQNRDAWCMACCCFTQQQLLLRACVRACVAAFVIDTIYELTRRRRPRRGESNFRIEIFEINGCGQKGEFGGLPPELVLRGRPKQVDISIRKFDFPRLA